MDGDPLAKAMDRIRLIGRLFFIFTLSRMKLCEMSMSFYLNACIQLGLICFYLRARMRAVRAILRAESRSFLEVFFSYLPLCQCVGAE
jgi:hypothetical protein